MPDESRVKPQPLQPEELKALSEWLALGPNFTLSAHEQRRLIATIEEARSEQPVRVYASMVGEAAAAWCGAKYGYRHPLTMSEVSRSPEMVAAVDAAVAEYNRLVRTGAIQLAAAPKEKPQVAPHVGEFCNTCRGRIQIRCAKGCTQYNEAILVSLAAAPKDGEE